MIEPNPAFEPGETQENDSWKNQLASRLDTYRSKNKRKLSGEFSMRFNFEGELAGPRQQICVPLSPDSDIEIHEPAEPNGIAAEATAQVHSEAAAQSESSGDGSPGLPQPAAPDPPSAPRPSVPFKRRVVMEANVIEFPRLFPPELPPSSVLAESVVPTSPRILDAPEIAEPLLQTPILDGMRLEHLETRPAAEMELPLQVASVARRAYAGLGDCLIVLAASSLFFYLCHKLLAELAITKALLGTSLVVPIVLWAFYQYLFILYGARTPGMLLARLGFSTFQGTAPNRRQRMLRLVGIAVSCSSLMLGFVWAFFDDDALCWHDRISRTYSFRQ